MQHILYIYLNLFQNWRFWTIHITQLFLFEIHYSWVGMHFEGNAWIALWCSLLCSCFCLCLCRSTVAVLHIAKLLLQKHRFHSCGVWFIGNLPLNTYHTACLKYTVLEHLLFDVFCKRTWGLNVPLLCICMRPYGFDLVFVKNLGFSVCLWDVQMLVWFGIDFTWFSDLQDVDLFCGECVSECWDVSWGTGNSSPATTWIWRPSIPLSPFWSGSAVVCSLVFGHVMVSTLVHYL